MFRFKRVARAPRKHDFAELALPRPLSAAAALEVFLKSLLDGAMEVARARDARTMTSSHL